MSRDGDSPSMCPCGADFDAHAAKHASGCPRGPARVELGEAAVRQATRDLARDPLPSREQVNHPAHYGGDTPFECIRVIEDWGLGFSAGSALKYILRAGKKHPDVREDLQKAAWYLRRAEASTFIPSRVETVTLEPRDVARAHGLSPVLGGVVSLIRGCEWFAAYSTLDVVIAHLPR